MIQLRGEDCRKTRKTSPVRELWVRRPRGRPDAERRSLARGKSAPRRRRHARRTSRPRRSPAPRPVPLCGRRPPVATRRVRGLVDPGRSARRCVRPVSGGQNRGQSRPPSNPPPWRARDRRARSRSPAWTSVTGATSLGGRRTRGNRPQGHRSSRRGVGEGVRHEVAHDLPQGVPHRPRRPGHPLGGPSSTCTARSGANRARRGRRVIDELGQMPPAQSRAVAPDRAEPAAADPRRAAPCARPRPSMRRNTEAGSGTAPCR